MTYQTNIPQPTDLISVSQDDILQNFQAIDAAWNINHEDFNAALQGKHKFVEMPNQGADPAGAATEFTIFSKVSAGGQSEIFYKRDAEASSYQLTGINPSVSGSPAFAGYTFLPGAILIQWVRCSVSNTGSRGKQDGASITFPTTFSSTPYTVQLSVERNGTTTASGVVNATSITSSGFTLRVGTNDNDAIHVLAIGPA